MRLSADERRPKTVRHSLIGKTPPNDCALSVMLAVPALWLNAMPDMKLVHCIELSAQAAGRDDGVNVMRIFLFDPRSS